MNAFHVLGVVLALWAVAVTFLGIRSEGFPGERGEKIVSAISVVLVLATIAAGVLTAANEGEHEEGDERTASVFP